MKINSSFNRIFNIKLTLKLFFLIKMNKWGLGIGDWGLGIGD